MAPIRYLAKSMPSIRRLNLRFITTSTHLRQEAQLAEASPTQTPLPPNPASGSPMYNENWRNPSSTYYPANDATTAPISHGFLRSASLAHMESLAQMLNASGLLDQFAKWTTEQRWADLKELFELWIKSLDYSGKPNKPDVDLYNHYLRANFMVKTSIGQLLDIVEQMEDYKISPNTASFNIVLKAMLRAGESLAAEKLIERMRERGQSYKDSLPDDESYDLIISSLSANQIDRALKYIDLALESGYMLSMDAFNSFVQSCINKGRLDILVSVIERCKKMDQNKSLSPPWRTCYYIADVAMQLDNSDLTYYALEFIAKWIARGEIARPPVLLSVDEGLVLSALGTAGRSCNSKLLDGSWAILKRSLRQKTLSSPELFLGKIYAHANMGNLQKAFSTLHEFETAYENSVREDAEDLFSPFHSLGPLVNACSKKGFRTLDMVYHQLENLSNADPPYKSIAALNCIILGSANIWDVDRAYQTFVAIDATFGLTPNIHSYNALLCAFGKLGKIRGSVSAIRFTEQFPRLPATFEISGQRDLDMFDHAFGFQNQREHLVLAQLRLGLPVEADPAAYRRRRRRVKRFKTSHLPMRQEVRACGGAILLKLDYSGLTFWTKLFLGPKEKIGRLSSQILTKLLWLTS